MNLWLVGVSHRTASLEVREHLAVAKTAIPQLLHQLREDLASEAVCISTCNRTEWYVHGDVTVEQIVDWLARQTKCPKEIIQQSIYNHAHIRAVEHLFRVVSSLESLVLGEVQIAGQVKIAYELALQSGLSSPLLHQLFQQSRQVAKRIRKETKLTSGKASVSSLAIDYLFQVYDQFHDKTVLIIGTGKIGELTLRHLQTLKPGKVLICNRHYEKAEELAKSCRGQAVPWESLFEAISKADILLSTTGAPEPIVKLDHMQQLAKGRLGRHWAIIDLAIPRDFEPNIASLEQVDLMVNIDDLKDIREKVIQERIKHIPEAEAIVLQEKQQFAKEWSRRLTGPAIARLSSESDAIRMEIEQQCLSKMNGQLSEQDRETIRGAFRLLQNKLLHKPIAAIQEEARAGQSRGLFEAIVKLFRLGD